jgi:glutamate-1-semialdehyde 2,1-aminomutase
MGRYDKSLAYLERARLLTPGAAQTLSKMPARFPQGAFPVVVSHGAGAILFDVDGNTYVDWICGLGAMTLGYGCDRIESDIINQAMLGSSFSLPHKLELAVAEKLCSKIPCAEMVRFVSTGSEATEAAIRTARIATGRDIILTVGTGYHSWHSWFQAVKPWHPGVPKEYEYLVDGFAYNDLVSLERLFSYHSYGTEISQVAAVIMEPTLFDKPAPGFLEGVRDLCTKYGAVLIFDEVVCGGRWALAGGQEYFGVTPDLATFGKGLANGLPLGFLCGKREYMQHAELISGTFGGNALSLAACNAVMDVYEQEPVIDTMWRRGKELQDEFNSKAAEYGVQAVCDGYACKPRIVFNLPEPDKTKAMSLFLQETAAHGILLHPGGCNVSYALTDGDMDVTFKAINHGLVAVRHALDSNDWSALHGALIRPVVTVRN